jgi:NSS family neurotransmitter:Na+ symporter
MIFALGIPCSLSQGPWSHITLIKGKNILDSVDFIATNILLPLGGIILSIFVGWVWGLYKEQRIHKTEDGKTVITWDLAYTDAIKEITNDGKINFALAHVWVFLIKWVAPIAISIVFLQGIFA